MISIVDPHSPEDTDPPPLINIETKENTYSVEHTTEDKGRDQRSDIAAVEAMHIKYVAPLEDCLTKGEERYSSLVVASHNPKRNRTSPTIETDNSGLFLPGSAYVTFCSLFTSVFRFEMQ